MTGAAARRCLQRVRLDKTQCEQKRVRFRSNRNDPICLSPYLYRARNLVERFFNKIKHCRRVATRYDKLAANYLAFVQLASIRLWLSVNESASWAARCPVSTC